MKIMAEIYISTFNKYFSTISSIEKHLFNIIKTFIKLFLVDSKTEVGVTPKRSALVLLLVAMARE